MDSDIPLLEHKIGNIPVGICSGHNGAFYFWQQHGLKDIPLLHVDAHSDIGDFAPYKKDIDRAYYRELSISNFICAGVYYGFLSGEIYWLDPHVEPDIALREFDPSMLPTKNTINGVSRGVIMWKSPIIIEHTYIGDMEIPGRWNILQKMPTLQRYTLDIDLDAFALETLDATKYTYGYNKRIGKMIELVTSIHDQKGLPTRPELITITTSQRPRTYVPPNMAKTVLEDTIAALEKIYHKSNAA